MPTNISRNADRLLNRISGLFGKDRELDQLSSQVTELKSKALQDSRLTPAEMTAIHDKLAEIEKQFARFAAERGYPVGETRPTTPQSFKVYQEQQEIQFEYLAGKDLKGGVLGELQSAAKSNDARKLEALASKVALDIITSGSPAIAKDKVNLLRATLARVDDRAVQLSTMAAVREKLGAKLNEQWSLPGKPPIDLAGFDKASTFSTAATMHRTELPPGIKGTDKIFPNKPIPGWEQTVRAATKASLDDLAKSNNLFLSKIPAGGSATVAVKLDLNVGADGPPSVSDPAGTNATISELLERADKDGKTLKLTVGDSSGFENGPLGRTSMDVMRDTGNYHHALKAGLTFAAKKGEPGAAEALARLNAAETAGVFFGSKDDKLSKPADLAAAEKAAAKFVTLIDYDKAGFARVEPELGPIGLAAWGTKEFQMARPWVEADYRVHVSRGLSNHILANYTGAQKGLIGLHAIGLRPLDQGQDRRGNNPIDVMNMITKTQGLPALFNLRSGAPESALGSAPRDASWAAAEARHKALETGFPAFKTFQSEVSKLQDDLNQKRDAGMPVVELMEKMREGVRGLLDKADATSPGFKQAYWDQAHESTRVVLRAGWEVRKLLPDEIRDETIGSAIGLLSQLPYQSDLVIQTQPKIGEGGGPDAYQHVRDVGAIIAGTSEAATDAIAWKLGNQDGNRFNKNFPAWYGLVYGAGPMHDDEIQRLDR
jgi:Domain of unknown function (DUF362)